MTSNPPDQKDENPSMHLHEVLAMEYAALHGPPPAGSATAVPLQENLEKQEAKKLQEQKQQQYLEEIWAAVHQLPEKRAALCISGGGIRSATFALGVLQGLARCGLLGKFHYLSTVSGGGYIGGWLTAWILRAKNGLDEVSTNLAKPRDDTRPNPEPTQMQNLRSYSNYLSPRLGLLSADTWTLVATYLRNLLLNWLVLIPLLAAALTIPWIYAAVLMTNPPPNTCIPFWLGAIGLVVGVAYMGLNLPSGKKARGNETSFLCFCLLPLFLAAVFITTFWAWFTNHGGQIPEFPFLPGMAPHSSSLFLWFGIAVHLVAWALSLLRAHGFRFLEFLAVIASGAIGGLLLWVAAIKFFPQPLKFAELYSCFAIPLFLGLFLVALIAFAGLSSRWTGDPDREWWARANGWLLIVALGWMVVSGLVLFGPWLLGCAVSAITGGIAGIITVLAGRSSSIPANEKQSGKSGPLALIFSKASSFAALTFIAVLVVLIIIATTWVVEKIVIKLEDVDWNLETKSAALGQVAHSLNIILYTPWWLVIAVGVALAAIGVLMACVINPNRFSMHAMYRDRLIRAYLGASNRQRDPNPFTGFDEKDNPRMADLWPGEKFGGKLMPVINIALNLVHGKNLAWQERKAASFTVSPLHCGSYVVGYRKTGAARGQSYGSEEDVSAGAETSAPSGPRYGGEEGISLGTAIAISGAAASPNMGYHSSPLVTFILTLLNVRLGAWLGNPGKAGDKTFQLGYPNFSVRPIVAEAFGLTDDSNPYVYLSDGGHFENLGLYEMVLRRCHYIVVSDAGQDPACSFSDLGDAVRKIRIDLGIPIDFGPMSIFPRSDKEAQNKKGRNCAIGKILYSKVDGSEAEDGVLVYIKPACYGEEPRDIYEYFKRNELFPHESTADQFFSESQFESYRMLGAYTMDKVCPREAADFESFIKGINDYLVSSDPTGPETPNA
jgi:Patatin-like phospholipase